ncbi:hypothetical protein CKA32_006620 [Geitlerinema sp. FC II]|nr:hypothetical protein CKA32_006620 [Geitlerinema sp. FC II]
MLRLFGNRIPSEAVIYLSAIAIVIFSRSSVKPPTIERENLSISKEGLLNKTEM